MSGTRKPLMMRDKQPGWALSGDNQQGSMSKFWPDQNVSFKARARIACPIFSNWINNSTNKSKTKWNASLPQDKQQHIYPNLLAKHSSLPLILRLIRLKTLSDWWRRAYEPRATGRLLLDANSTWHNQRCCSSLFAAAAEERRLGRPEIMICKMFQTASCGAISLLKNYESDLHQRQSCICAPDRRDRDECLLHQSWSNYVATCAGKA